MVQFETEVLEIIPRTPGVKSFRFKIKEDVDFKPGQFFFVTIRVDVTERTKHFSFSNSPTEKGYVEFTKRITKSEYSKALDRLKIGDWVKLKMPLGSFMVWNFKTSDTTENCTKVIAEGNFLAFEDEYEKIAFLSGGIGITPIRSICKFSTDRRLSTNIVLIYGNNKEEDIIFRQDLDQMANANKNMRIVYTLTSTDIDKKTWPGRTGYIDDKMIQEEIADYQDRVFYICGPPKMVESLTDILKNKLDVSEDKIRIENFSGY